MNVGLVVSLFSRFWDQLKKIGIKQVDKDPILC